MNGNTSALTPEQVDGWNQFNGIASCHLCHTPPVFSDGDFHNTGLRHWSADIGREEVTGNIADRAKFKTPSLRNVGLRENFFHTGADGRRVAARASGTHRLLVVPALYAYFDTLATWGRNVMRTARREGPATGVPETAA